jgi:RimJ/RimL family protein N-acetyltransferase
MKGAIELKNDKVRLRTLTPEDANLVLEWANDKEVVKNFSFFQQPATYERIFSYITEKYQSNDDLLFAIFTNSDEYVGNVGLHEIDRVNDTARLGIIIGKREFWNRGYAQETIKLLLKYAFTQAGIHKIYLNAFSTNVKGLNLYTKLGFQREGLLRSEYKLRDRYQDLVRMAMLAEDYHQLENFPVANT